MRREAKDERDDLVGRHDRTWRDRAVARPSTRRLSCGVAREIPKGLEIAKQPRARGAPMSRFLLYLSVFLGAATPIVEVWIAVPAGILLGLPIFPAMVVGFLGNAASLVPLILAGDRLRAWWNARRRARGGEPVSPRSRAGKSSSRARRLFDRYGIPGLAFLGPFVVGVHVAAVAAIGAGADRRRVLVWFLFALATSAVFFGTLAVLGLATFVDPQQLPDLGG
jgi:Ca2+/H+ antiporter, TMEM165/GDT1 family